MEVSNRLDAKTPPSSTSAGAPRAGGGSECGEVNAGVYEDGLRDRDNANVASRDGWFFNLDVYRVIAHDILACSSNSGILFLHTFERLLILIHPWTCFLVFFSDIYHIFIIILPIQHSLNIDWAILIRL